MNDVVVGAGLVSLVAGAWSGFVLLQAVDHPERLRRVGVVDPSRIRQLHLDWIIMGCVMVAVGLAVPGLPRVAGILVLVGGVVNPLTFLPMAFSRLVAERRWFQWLSLGSFLSLCAGLTVATVSFVGG